MGRLTDTQLRAWVRGRKPLAGKSDGGGLTFTLSKAGTAGWVLRYLHNGRARECAIGRYPDIGLANARGIASELRGRIQKGEDVAVTRQVERAQKALNAATFRDLATAWIERALSASYGARVRRRFELYAYPLIGSLPPEEVRPQHIDRILRTTAETAPHTANKLLGYLKRVFSYARKRHILTVNPAADFDTSDAGGKETSRRRALSLDEIRGFLAACKARPTLGRGNELAFRLLILLGVRKGELVGAAWEELDLDAGLWHLPGTRTKTAEPITIPLPALGVEWFRELNMLAAGSPWVFPGRRTGHISSITLNIALSRVAHGLPHFTLHDLRRTMRTQLAALGVAPHVAERCLNHKLKGVAGIYDRHDYLEERRQALQQWAAVLGLIDRGGNVVPLKRARP
jgi:integrase